MPTQSNDGGTPTACLLLLVVAVFSQVSTCNSRARIDKVEKQQADIQAAIIEIREHRK
jgi:hypothetical protein